MRVVCENTDTEVVRIKWIERAFQSIYGVEFEGDKLLLARQNLLYSYADYMEAHLLRSPTEREMLSIARIISWNLWQMDALTKTIPYQTVKEQYEQLSFLENETTSKQVSYCKIKDWRSEKIIDFNHLTERGK